MALAARYHIGNERGKAVNRAGQIDLKCAVKQACIKFRQGGR